MREELNQYLDSTTSMASALGLAALFSMSLIGARQALTPSSGDAHTSARKSRYNLRFWYGM